MIKSLFKDLLDCNRLYPWECHSSCFTFAKRFLFFAQQATNKSHRSLDKHLCVRGNKQNPYLFIWRKQKLTSDSEGLIYLRFTLSHLPKLFECQLCCFSWTVIKHIRVDIWIIFFISYNVWLVDLISVHQVVEGT